MSRGLQIVEIINLQFILRSWDGLITIVTMLSMGPMILVFKSTQVQEIYLFSKMSIAALGPTEHHVQTGKCTSE